MITDALKYLMGLVQVETLSEQGGVGRSRVVAVPSGVRLDTLEQFQDAPNRIKHNAVLVASAAFIAYVNRFKNPETSVYLDIFNTNPSFSAILDHHGASTPSWTSHRARFAPKLSMEWQAWLALHKSKPFAQAELLAFFEDHANDLQTPEPAAMLTALSKFELVEKHTYESAVNLDNGQVALTYIKAGQQTKVQFPHTFTLAIPVLENEAPATLEGRLRFRAVEGELAFTFQFKQDPDRVARDEYRRLAAEVQKGIDDVHHYEGVSNAG